MVRFDRGREYYGKYTMSGRTPSSFAKFLQEHEIVVQYTMFGSLNHNCVAKIRNRILIDMMISMRVMQSFLMGYADISYLSYLHNGRSQIEYLFICSDITISW